MEKLAEPKRLSQIQQVLKGSVIALIQAAPQNETNRALVLAAVKKPVPPEADTYEKIKDWIETNFKPSSVVVDEADAITATIIHTDIETGNCRYSRSRRGSSQESISNARMLQIIEEARLEQEGFDELANRVFEELREDARENDWPDMDPEGRDDTYEHCDGEPEDHACAVADTASVRLRLRAWLNLNARGEFER